MSQLKSTKILIDIATDKSSTPARTSRAQVVALNGPNSDLWKVQPALEEAGTKFITIGTALADADAMVKSLEAQLAGARGLRDTKQNEFDVAYGVYVANAQTYAGTPEDAASLGLVVRTKNKYPLIAPAGVDASFDLMKGEIQIHISKTPGVRSFAVEISSDPIGPGTWQRLRGAGAVQDLSGYAPGLYWVRAASVRAKAQSDYTAPVAVVVK